MNYLQSYEYLNIAEDAISDHSTSCEIVLDEEVPKYLGESSTVWDSYDRPRNYLIITVEQKFIDQALDFIEKHHLKYDVLCRGVHLHKHKEAMDHYKDLIRSWIQNRTSLLAIEEGSERIVGVIVAKVNYIDNREVPLLPQTSRVFVFNHRIQEIQDLKCNVRQLILEHLLKEEFECLNNKYLEVKLICADRIEKKYLDIEKMLLTTVVNNIADDLKIKVIIGIMPSVREQTHFKEFEFTQFFKMYYSELKKKGNVIFPIIGKEHKIIGFYKLLHKPERGEFIAMPTEEENEE